jgi:exodeoxyribonuclease VII large subunit
VGHEIDFTIADFAADQRAPTPTAAAEMVLPRKADLVEQLKRCDDALSRALRSDLRAANERLQALVKRLTDPTRRLRENQQRLDDMSLDLVRRFEQRVRQLRDRLARASGRLNALSPLAVLDRGYSIAHKLPQETIVKDVAVLGVGDRLRIRFAKGRAMCRVEEKE